MSDGITDAERMKEKKIAAWRERVMDEALPEIPTIKLMKELCKRDGVLTKHEGLCYVNSGCQYPNYEDCAVCIKEHPVTILVIKP